MCLHYLFYSPSLGYAISCSSCLPRPFHLGSIMLIFPHIRSRITSGGLWQQSSSSYTAELHVSLNYEIRELFLLVKSLTSRNRARIRFPAGTNLLSTPPHPGLLCGIRLSCNKGVRISFDGLSWSLSNNWSKGLKCVEFYLQPARLLQGMFLAPRAFYPAHTQNLNSVVWEFYMY
jgi:hypothetical protein